MQNASNLKKGEIILFVIPAAKYLNENLKLLSTYINRLKYRCIYVTVNRPYTSLIKILESKKINPNEMFIIDGITPVSFGMKKIDNAIFLGSPRSLTNISISTQAIMNKIKDNKTFLFLDSLSTLCLYNDAQNVSKFMHFLVNKMREFNVVGIILNVEKETDDVMLKQLSQFCDRIVEIN